jgi:hypothetical protein
LPDFSNIDFSNIDIDAILKDYQDGQDIGEPEPITSFFEAPAPVMPEAPAEVPVSAGLFDFDTEKPTPTSFDFDAIGKFLPSFFDTGEKPSIPSFIPKQVLDQVPVMPAPVSDLPVIPNFPIQQPMNFTGLPNIPVMPNIPVPPAAQVYSPPAMPAYTQPRVEDIIAPIRTGSTRRLPQPGLFNLR